MRTHSKLFFSFLLALQFISLEVSAESVDKPFYKSSRVPSIGQAMRSMFDLGGYNKSYALVVGISDFTYFNPLETKNDPIKVKNYLLNEAGFDYVHLLTGDRVTLKRLRQLMVDVFPSRMGKQDRFLFYWSGHGVTDTSNNSNFGHLPLANSKDNEFSSMLDMSSLSQWDKRMPSKQTLYLLDACFSGYAGLTGQSSIKRQSIKQYGVASRQVLTAGRKGEQTLVMNDRLSSVFTTAVLEGLRGKADYYKDNVITANELNTYVRTRVRGLKEDYKWPKSITPSLGRLHNGGEGEFFFLADAKPEHPNLRIESAATGSVSTQSGTYSQEPSDNMLNRSGEDKQGSTKRRIGKYIDNGDGTVTDIRSELMWKKCNEGQSGDECEGKSRLFKPSDAFEKFQNVSFSGYRDWRLPTQRELKKLLNCSNGGIPQILDKCKGVNKPFTTDTSYSSAFPNSPRHSPIYPCSKCSKDLIDYRYVVSDRKFTNYNYVKLVRSRK